MKLEGGQSFYESVESGYGALLRGVTHFGQYGLVEIKESLVMAVWAFQQIKREVHLDSILD